MPRKVTVEFDDGSSHVYENAPDDVTPEQITERAQKDFSGRAVVHLDGGKKPKDPADSKHSTEEYEDPQLKGLPKEYKPLAKDMLGAGKESSLKNAAGLGESLLTGVTGLASTSVGGLLGGARAAYSMLHGEGLDASARKGAETSGKIQQLATYQPRTDTGKAIVGMGGAVGALPGKAAGYVGGEVGEALGGQQGRLRGEAIGEVTPALAATAMGLRGVGKSAAAAAARERAPMPGKDFSVLRDLKPEEAERMARMTEQGVKPTLGSVTKDPAQFRYEEQMAQKPEGADLRARALDNNEALVKAVEDTDKMRAGRKTTENRRETGQAVASALEEKEAASIKGVNEKYQAARDAGETKKLVSTKPLDDYLAKTQYRRKSVQALNDVASQLDAMKKNRKGGKVTIDDMEEIYKTANELSSPQDPVTARHMKEVKAAVNAATEGAGGDMYREARLARRAHSLEFDDRKAIANLVDKKANSATDYKTKSEDVFNKVVVNSSLNELQDVTNSLLNGEHATPKMAQAVRELQGETIDYLLEQAGTKGEALAKGATTERGVANLSPVGLRQGIAKIGKDKLEHLLGKEALDRLYKTVQNSRDLKEAPGKASNGVINTQEDLKAAAMDAAKTTILGRIPGVKYIAPVFEERAKVKANKARVEEALTPRKASPETASSEAAKVKKTEKTLTMKENQRAAAQAIPAAALAPIYNKEKDEK